MKESNRKRVEVAYFKRNGEVYRVVEEFVVGEYSESGVIQKVKGRLRFSRMDVVILDGGDGVRPYIKPYLIRTDNKTESLGLF